MWILFARSPIPDVAYWPGRRLLAALDAMLWPALAVWALSAVPHSAALIRPVVISCGLIVGAQRIRTAVWSNHRYRFSTWRVGRVVALLMLVGLVLKLSMH